LYYYYYYYHQTLRNEISNIEIDRSSISADKKDIPPIKINQPPDTSSAEKTFKTPIHLLGY